MLTSRVASTPNQCCRSSLHLLPKLGMDQFGIERVEGTPEGAGQTKSHTKELVHGAGQSNPNRFEVEDL